MAITRRQRQVNELARSSPVKRDVFTAGRFPVDSHWREHDEEWGVGVGDHELLTADLDHLDAELLQQLAPGRVGVGLAGLAFAAGELPESAVSLVVGPLADEEFVAA